jgi:L-fuconolactonase
MAQINVSKEFRGSTFRQQTELNAWTKKRQEAALEPELPIIDPHHHVWEKELGRYLIHELAEDVNNSGHNIIATVFIEAGSMYRAGGPEAMKPVGEVEFVNGIAAMSVSGKYGKTRLCDGIIGHADLTLGDGARPVLEALTAAGNGRFRGIRHGVTWDTGNAARFGRRQPPQHQVLDPVFRKGFAHLKPLGL